MSPASSQPIRRRSRARVERRARTLRRGRRLTVLGLCGGALLVVATMTAAFSPLVHLPDARSAFPQTGRRAIPVASSTGRSTAAPRPAGSAPGSRPAGAPAGVTTTTARPATGAGTGARGRPDAPTSTGLPHRPAFTTPPSTSRVAPATTVTAPPASSTTTTVPSTPVTDPHTGTTTVDTDCGASGAPTPVTAVAVALVGVWQQCGGTSLFSSQAGAAGISIRSDGTWQLLAATTTGGLVVLTGPGDSGTWREVSAPSAAGGLLVSFQPTGLAASLPPWQTAFRSGPPPRVRFRSAGVTVDYESTTQTAKPGG